MTRSWTSRPILSRSAETDPRRSSVADPLELEGDGGLRGVSLDQANLASGERFCTDWSADHQGPERAVADRKRHDGHGSQCLADRERERGKGLDHGRHHERPPTVDRPGGDRFAPPEGIADLATGNQGTGARPDPAIAIVIDQRVDQGRPTVDRLDQPVDEGLENLVRGGVPRRRDGESADGRNRALAARAADAQLVLRPILPRGSGARVPARWPVGSARPRSSPEARQRTSGRS